MFDTMTITKAGGALCGAFLIFLLGKWAAEGLYTTAPASHGGEEVAQAYSIDTGADEAASDEAPAEATAAEGATAEAPADTSGEATAEAPAATVAAGDAAAGEKVFNKCKACHKTDGTNATGPHLDGVVGRTVASVEGFKYSNGMTAHGGDWTPEALDAFLTDPKGVVPGTKMTFAGLPKPEDRANVIAYLESLGG